MQNYLSPHWSAPKNIRAYATLRSLGNLATNVGDDLEIVLQNRHKLTQDLQLPNQPYWLQQAHTNKAVIVDYADPKPIADASYTKQPSQICVVLTADCLPLLLCNKSGTMVAAIHAGWKGLAAGIIESTLKSLGVSNTTSNQMLVWLGPAIGPNAFEVSDDVRQMFLQQDPMAKIAFIQTKNDKWNCNIYILAKQRLNKYGITDIYGGNFCTFNQADKFFSFRRDKGVTGRMASLIWIAKNS